MESMYLAEFLNLAETCNYMESAENMNISTSALSKHISRLEDELGVKLFTRTTRTVVLNSYGVILRDYALRILDLEQECLNCVEQEKSKERGSLCVGYMPIMHQYGIPELLSEYVALHPEIQFEMQEIGNPGAFFSAGKLNFVFMDYIPPKIPGLVSITCYTDRLAAILPLDHPYANASGISVEALAGEEFIFHGRSRDELFRSAVNFKKYAKNAGFEPKISTISSNTNTIMKLIRNGMGVSVLYHKSGPDFLASNVAMVDFDPPITYQVYVHYSKANGLTKTERGFIRFLKGKFQDNQKKQPPEEAE